MFVTATLQICRSAVGRAPCSRPLFSPRDTLKQSALKETSAQRRRTTPPREIKLGKSPTQSGT